MTLLQEARPRLRPGLGFDLDLFPECLELPVLPELAPERPEHAFGGCAHPDEDWVVVGVIEINGRSCLELMCPDCLAVDYVPNNPHRGSPRLSR